jgi:Ran GTPase-activating protein (RanGAP) involved in mRNA processing and transport
MNPSVALCWVAALLTVTTVAGRGVAVIDDSERLCTLSEAKTGWVSASFNLEGCVVLNGTGSVVTDADAELLASELGKSSTLKSLLLEDSGISDAAAAKLAKALASHNSLLELNLAGNEISAGAADALVELIETNQKLAVLDLQRNKLMSAGVQKVLNSIEDNQGLTELSLNNNGDDVGHAPEEHTDQGAVARSFSGLLHERTDLKVLRIGSTGITTSGVKMIMDAMGKNDHLEEFEIGFNSIGPDGGELIGESLVENTVLKRLFIDGSDIGDDGAAEVAHALRSNTVLEELSLKSNSLSDQAARSFADVLEEIDSTGIKKLRLGYRAHGIRGEWFHYIEKLLEVHHSPADRKHLRESEQLRVCSLLESNGLDIKCAKLTENGFHRIGDLLLLSDADCEQKLHLPTVFCSALKAAAEMVEKPLPAHVEL